MKTFLDFFKKIKANHLIVIGIILILGMMLYTISSSSRLKDKISKMEGQLIVLDEIRADLKERRVADSVQKELANKQIDLFSKMDKALDKSFELYAENLKSIKKKYNETISNITVYSSDDLKSYFANLPNPED